MQNICRKIIVQIFPLLFCSRVFHLNEHYISRVFKEETGENFLSYLNRIRIEEAKKLLLESDKKIYEIAEETVPEFC